MFKYALRCFCMLVLDWSQFEQSPPGSALSRSMAMQSESWAMGYNRCHLAAIVRLTSLGVRVAENARFRALLCGTPGGAVPKSKLSPRIRQFNGNISRRKSEIRAMRLRLLRGSVGLSSYTTSNACGHALGNATDAFLVGAEKSISRSSRVL